MLAYPNLQVREIGALTSLTVGHGPLQGPRYTNMTDEQFFLKNLELLDLEMNRSFIWDSFFSYPNCAVPQLT